MPDKFDINSKELKKAKPCIAQIIRDDGSVEWYENCKAGQLLEIKSAGQKAYINLDYNKILNMNVMSKEEEVRKVKQVIETIDNDAMKLEKKIDERTKSYNDQLEKLRELKDNNKIEGIKARNKREKIQSSYDKMVEQLKGKYVKLNKNKVKNIGSQNKPILGFVCYEKEFNALPYKAKHDSKAITKWLDEVLKNGKDFMAQRAEAFGRTAVYIILALAGLLFIFFKFGGGFFEEQAKQEVTSQVAKIPLYFAISKGLMKKWLNKR